jgi:hypothetical protein
LCGITSGGMAADGAIDLSSRARGPGHAQLLGWRIPPLETKGKVFVAELNEALEPWCCDVLCFKLLMRINRIVGTVW